MTRSHILRLLWSTGLLLSSLAGAAEGPALTPPGTARAGSQPSLPPLPPSPIAQFRQLLEAVPEEQARQLAGKSERSRRALEAKLREYQLLSPEERDLRLRATELRWYLRPLMEIPPTNRLNQISAVPGEYRSLVQERLEQWDHLPSDMQRELLDKETFIEYFLRIQGSTATQQEALREALPPGEREKLEREMARWETLPADRRQRMCNVFEQFFELPRKEQQRTLHAFSPAERLQMETTLQAFARLPPGQRRICLASFRKFAEFTAVERAEFLRNADRWKSLTPKERDTWRRLVTRLPPPPPSLVQRQGLPPAPPPPKVRPAPTSSPPSSPATR